MKEENEDGDALKILNLYTNQIINNSLNTIIKIFSEDSIIENCIQFTLWSIHGDNGKVWFH